MTLRKNHRNTKLSVTAERSTGHAGPPDRTNGHAPASSERGGVSAHRDQAASDDASGASVASAAISAFAAGTGREAHADAAPPRPNGETPGAVEKNSDGTDVSKVIPPGECSLPATVDEFVDEIHSRIDLFEVWHSLLRSTDDKIKQRAAERLTDLRYKDAAGLAEDSQQIIFDMPRPNRE
jgi:hypothetical protein